MLGFLTPCSDPKITLWDRVTTAISSTLDGRISYQLTLYPPRSVAEWDIVPVFGHIGPEHGSIFAFIRVVSGKSFFHLPAKHQLLELHTLSP